MSALKNGLTGLAAFVIACGVVVPALAAVDAYLQIGDIGGESTDQQHGGQIEVQSWSFGTSQMPQYGGASQGPQVGMMMGSPGTGSQQPPTGPGTVTVTKTYDKSSPKLAEACARGRHFPTVTLSARKAGGDPHEYLTYDLQNVMVSGYSISSGGDRPTESISLNFTKIEFKNNAASPTASPSMPGTTAPGMRGKVAPGQ